MNKKGSVVAIAFILGMVFFIAVSALLQHSSGEMKHVKAISAVKKAELLSISGIDWAESELVRKITESQLKKDLPDLRPGMTVNVGVKIKEGEKTPKERAFPTSRTGTHGREAK